MKFFLVFLLVTVTYFGQKEVHGFFPPLKCKDNHIVFHNKLRPGSILEINCLEPRVARPYLRHFHRLGFNENPYKIILEWQSLSGKFTVKCNLSHGPNQKFYYNDLQAYSDKASRCGQLRSWIAKVDGIWFTEKYAKPEGWVFGWKTR
ncbi:hypothetical protein EUTSA_v10026501mg [Eutrema salsugineum]|uniref:Uncharacterized protein n=1 Tax=Eutrema salsugineum TaxID=72664 RepID=V4M042_EUTSA|nr:S-protein homolog 30 [Eutrema salsugineum]ESQ56330.1 hypothetical protein EUTSA_v10026501mg [Eutrema salsugineum]